MKPGIRRRLTLSVIAVSALSLALLVLIFNLALRDSLDSDASSLAEGRARAALEGVEVNGDKVRVREPSDEDAPDPQVWIYAGSDVLEHPQPSQLDPIASSLAARGSGEVDDNPTDTRLFAVPIMDAGSRLGTVVSGISLEPYERTAQRTLVGSLLLAGFMLVLIGLAARVVISRALRPVASMTASAASWSEHDLDRRFDVGTPTDELTELAFTFDRMLDRMAGMLRHERSFTAELSHELRTPLASILAEAEVALRRPREADEYRDALERIASRANDLKGALETLMEIARIEGGATGEECADLAAVARSAVDSASAEAERRGISTSIDPVAGAWVGASPEAVERALAPVLENALAYADGAVRVAVLACNGSAAISVSDDGPGFADDERERVFEPGWRGSAAAGPDAPAGTGLGLSLARRLARALGGDVIVEQPGHGAELLLVLPLASAER